MEKTLALFDFDGTLYKRDSLLEFTKFYKGHRAFYVGVLRLSISLAGLKLKIRNNEKVKSKYISHFFKDANADEFKLAGQHFATQIDNHINRNIFTIFQDHVTSGHDVRIVTASSPEWILPWADRFGVRVIGTELEIIDHRITGKFASRNCYGPEKVTRIANSVNLNGYSKIFVYGSGKGDDEMLGLRKNN